MEVSAGVTKIVKDVIGWMVVIDVQYGFGSFTVQIPTLQTNPQLAVEDARKQLFDLGGSLMNGFQQPGSLE